MTTYTPSQTAIDNGTAIWSNSVVTGTEQFTAPNGRHVTYVLDYTAQGRVGYSFDSGRMILGGGAPTSIDYVIGTANIAPDGGFGYDGYLVNVCNALGVPVTPGTGY